ncbi:MAG: hypothetical protein IPO72_18325 [Saprospiraceae bacterium]|nr:hypothetical protein [Candidatus Vicinibacter affinis]
MEYGRYTPSINVNPPTATNYSVTVTDAVGCSAVASSNLYINPKPKITVSATPLNVCKLGTSNLLATILDTGYSK